MPTARRLTAPALVTITLALAYLDTATTAGAMPPDPRDTYSNQTPPPATTVVTHTGSPVWIYLVVALAVVVLTLVLAWTVTRIGGHTEDDLATPTIYLRIRRMT